jgi:hypothetical protein
MQSCYHNSGVSELNQVLVTFYGSLMNNAKRNETQLWLRKLPAQRQQSTLRAPLLSVAGFGQVPTSTSEKGAASVIHHRSGVRGRHAENNEAIPGAELKHQAFAKASLGDFRSSRASHRVSPKYLVSGASFTSSPIALRTCSGAAFEHPALADTSRQAEMG